jgi:GNAT superfamily N-acetyltransferase
MLSVRNARETDLPLLARLHYAEQPAIHRDRLHASDGSTLCYLVAERNGALVGFGVLLLERPAVWTDANDHFPLAVDLFVAEAHRSQGVGRALLSQMERTARRHGKGALYLSVDPLGNPHALALYTRFGFRPLQQEPYHNTWRFLDSAGAEHVGEEWVIDMVKPLEDIPGGEQVINGGDA